MKHKILNMPYRSKGIITDTTSFYINTHALRSILFYYTELRCLAAPPPILKCAALFVC